MPPPSQSTRSERVASVGVRLFSAAVLLFLVAPILVVIPLSFNDSAYFSYPMSGFSLRWYHSLVASEDWRRAFMNIHQDERVYTSGLPGCHGCHCRATEFA